MILPISPALQKGAFAHFCKKNSNPNINTKNSPSYDLCDINFEARVKTPKTSKFVGEVKNFGKKIKDKTVIESNSENDTDVVEDFFNTFKYNLYF